MTDEPDFSATALAIAELLDQRGASYGDYRELCGRIAERFKQHWPEIEWGVSDVLIALAELKLARLAGTPNHPDSVRDLAGYAILLQNLIEVE